MFLNIDKQNPASPAVIDNEGNRLSYGELAAWMNAVGAQVEARSLVFLLCRNTVGSLAGYLGFVEHDAVPVTLNAKIDEELLANLLDIYTPAYLWAPSEEAERFAYEKVYECFGYSLLKTGFERYPLNDRLQLDGRFLGSRFSLDHRLRLSGRFLRDWLRFRFRFSLNDRLRLDGRFFRDWFRFYRRCLRHRFWRNDLP